MIETTRVTLTDKSRPKVEKALKRANKQLVEIDKLIKQLTEERKDSCQLIRELEELLEKGVAINPLVLPV